MSYMEIIQFKPHPIKTVRTRFDNSWGFIPRIFDKLFNTYIKKEREFDSWSFDSGRRVTKLVHEKVLQPFELSVLLFTMDAYCVGKSNFGKMSDDLSAFDLAHPPGEDCCNHLPGVAEIFKKEQETDTLAIGLYGSSVGQDKWFKNKECPTCGQKTDEYREVHFEEANEVYEVVGWLSNM